MAHALTDFLVYCISAAVDVITYLLFQILCILSLAVYHVVKLPGFLLYQLLSSVVTSVPYAMDSLVSMVVSVAKKSTTSITGAAISALQRFVVMLANIFYDLLSHANTALFEFVTLVGTCIINMLRVGGYSLLSIGTNFTNVVSQVFWRDFPLKYHKERLYCLPNGLLQLSRTGLQRGGMGTVLVTR
ncbi:hypothetical protein R1sor_007378 [Riccia sorocarpa]|uniref:Uncharacterized protein n=1 Tax=Riccia sorocarpa TaxID=122646 RepID=A0ABD3HT82_9MARC